MRLIDADAINTKTFVDFVGNQGYISFGDALWMISELPTVEAKSVVHGEWIKIKDWNENDNALFECSNCHYGDTHAKAMKVPYCWHCGAKMSYADMRGEKND